MENQKQVRFFDDVDVAVNRMVQGDTSEQFLPSVGISLNPLPLIKAFGAKIGRGFKSAYLFVGKKLFGFKTLSDLSVGQLLDLAMTAISVAIMKVPPPVRIALGFAAAAAAAAAGARAAYLERKRRAYEGAEVRIEDKDGAKLQGIIARFGRRTNPDGSRVIEVVCDDGTVYIASMDDVTVKQVDGSECDATWEARERGRFASKRPMIKEARELVDKIVGQPFICEVADEAAKPAAKGKKAKAGSAAA